MCFPATSLRAGEPAPPRLPSRQAGFLLLEVLVATVVAGLVLGAVGAALAQGWRATRLPPDVLAATMLARADLQRRADEPGQVLPGFTVTRRTAVVALVARPSPVAPAPRLFSPQQAGATATPAQRPLVLPGLNSGVSQVVGRLLSRTVTVRTMSGRRIDFDTVLFDASS